MNAHTIVLCVQVDIPAKKHTKHVHRFYEHQNSIIESLLGEPCFCCCCFGVQIPAFPHCASLYASSLPILPQSLVVHSCVDATGIEQERLHASRPPLCRGALLASLCQRASGHDAAPALPVSTPSTYLTCLFSLHVTRVAQHRWPLFVCVLFQRRRRCTATTMGSRRLIWRQPPQQLL